MAGSLSDELDERQKRSNFQRLYFHFIFSKFYSGKMCVSKLVANYNSL